MSSALNISKTGGFQQVAVFIKRTFLAFRTHQHIQGLQLCRDRAGLVVAQQLLRDQDATARGQTLEDLGQEFVDFVFTPVMKNAADRKQVSFRQFVAERNLPPSLQCAAPRMIGLAWARAASIT